MPWATEVGCRQTENTQTENIESNYRGPSNCSTNRTAGEQANSDYENNFTCNITNLETFFGVHI